MPLLNVWYEEFLAASGTAPRRYQQDNKLLTYLGGWKYLASSAASGGSLTYTNAKGASVLVSFSGTSVELLARTGPDYGKVLITLDDGAAESYDLYSSSPAHQQSIYEEEGLDDTTHTLTITCEGDNSTLSSGTNISLDALRILGTLTEADKPIRYQQDDAALEYKGTWATATGTWAQYSLSSAKSAAGPGRSVNVSFTGTYLAWIAPMTPWYGKALVSVDEGPLVPVDLYSSSVKYKQRIFDTGLLDDAPHTLSIYWTGDRRTAASGTNISVDAFDVMGTLTDADAAPPILWRYQQTDPRITYVGAWSYGSTWSASGGSFASTGAAGAGALVNFTGTSVKLVARTAPWYGLAEVCVGGDTETVDFYSPTVAYKQVVFEKTGLSPGEHTLSIRVPGGQAHRV